MKNIVNFLEENQYFSGFVIENIDVLFIDNAVSVYIKRDRDELNKEANKVIRYKLNFLNIHSMEWDNSKHELLSSRIERSQFLDYIIFKTELSNVPYQFKLFLKDNRLLIIRFNGFSYEEIPI